jgi:hypothetical protein
MNDEYPMTGDEENLNAQMTKKGSDTAPFVIGKFDINSSFVIRHSSLFS